MRNTKRTHRLWIICLRHHKNPVNASGLGDSFGRKVSAYGENRPPNLRLPGNGELEVSRMTDVRGTVLHLARRRNSKSAYSNALFRRYRKERQRSDRCLA